MNAIFELWSKLDARARARLLVQPRVPARRRPRRAPRGPAVSSCGTTGWSAAGAAATARDGSNCTAPIFGVGLAVQPLEGQERLCPVLTTRARDPSPTPAGPGSFRGGCGVEKGGDADRRPSAPSCRTAATAPARSRGASRAGCRRSRTASGSTRAATTSASSAPSSPNVPDRRGRRVHAPVGGRRRLRRSARARPGGGAARTSPTATSRSSARARTTASSSREVDAELAEYEVDDEATAARARRASRAARRGWLDEDAEARRRALPRRASSTCSTSSATTASSSTGAPASCCRRRRGQFRAMLQRRCRLALAGRRRLAPADEPRPRSPLGGAPRRHRRRPDRRRGDARAQPGRALHAGGDRGRRRRLPCGRRRGRAPARARGRRHAERQRQSSSRRRSTRSATPATSSRWSRRAARWA